MSYSRDGPTKGLRASISLKGPLTVTSWQEAWLFLSLRAWAEGCGGSHCGQQRQAEGCQTGTEAVPVASGRAAGG